MSSSSAPGASSGAGRVVIASPSYSRVSDKLRRLSVGSLQCSLFCGGQRCKYENPARWSDEAKAMKGLFSHWVTPSILAMARPATHLLKHELIDQFKRCGIGTVINLQLPWEHSKCGPGLTSSGFTYEPVELMNHGVYFYNYGWMDYGVPTLESMLDMVKVVDFALSDGKVAIHCHAGLGRTGVLIACYLIYSERCNGDEAITHVRSKRPGSIQTRPQIEIVQQFSTFIQSLWPFYPTASCRALSFEDYLHNQWLLLHGQQQEHLRYVTKVVMEVCDRLATLAKSCDTGKQNGPMKLQHDDDIIDDNIQLCLELQGKLEAMQSEMNSSLEWSLLSTETSERVLLALLFNYFRQLKEPFLSSNEVSALKDNCTMDVLPLSKKFTLLKLLDTLSLSDNDKLVHYIVKVLVQATTDDDDTQCVQRLLLAQLNH